MNPQDNRLVCFDILLFGLLVLVLLFFHSGNWNRYPYQITDAHDVTNGEESQTGSGFHLLSCPELFTDDESNSGVVGKQEADIHLDAKSRHKLLAVLRQSMEHSHVVRAGRHFSGPLPSILESEFGKEDKVDVNIPGVDDNKRLCATIKAILEDDASEDQGSMDEDADLEVTISVVKLQTNRSESAMLRGSRFIKNAIPKFNSMIQLSSIDDTLHDAFGTLRWVNLPPIPELVKPNEIVQ